MLGCEELCPKPWREPPEEPVPLAPMPGDPVSEVAVLPMKERVRRETLDGMGEHRLIMITIKGQTVSFKSSNSKGNSYLSKAGEVRVLLLHSLHLLVS